MTGEIMFLRCLLRAALTFSLLSFGGPPRHAATATGSNRNPVALAASATTSSVPGAEPAAEPFLVKPYLQLGDARALASPERIELLWHTGDVDAVWTVETRRAAGRSWVKAAAPAMRRIALPGVEPHRVYDARITGL